jgi:hypothetical protein
MSALRKELPGILNWAMECPVEITDQLGGWSSQTVGQSYGKGYGLDVLSKWLSEIMWRKE